MTRLTPITTAAPSLELSEPTAREALMVDRLLYRARRYLALAEDLDRDKTPRRRESVGGLL